MTAPLKRISPELDSILAQIAQQQDISYVEASRRIAEQQQAIKSAENHTLGELLGMPMFKKR